MIRLNVKISVCSPATNNNTPINWRKCKFPMHLLRNDKWVTPFFIFRHTIVLLVDYVIGDNGKTLCPRHEMIVDASRHAAPTIHIYADALGSACNKGLPCGRYTC